MLLTDDPSIHCYPYRRTYKLKNGETQTKTYLIRYRLKAKPVERNKFKEEIKKITNEDQYRRLNELIADMLAETPESTDSTPDSTPDEKE